MKNKVLEATIISGNYWGMAVQTKRPSYGQGCFLISSYQVSNSQIGLNIQRANEPRIIIIIIIELLFIIIEVKTSLAGFGRGKIHKLASS